MSSVSCFLDVCKIVINKIISDNCHLVKTNPGETINDSSAALHLRYLQVTLSPLLLFSFCTFVLFIEFICAFAPVSSLPILAKDAQVDAWG